MLGAHVKKPFPEGKGFVSSEEAACREDRPDLDYDIA